MEKILLTEEEYNKLEAELEDRKVNVAPMISKKIGAAREQGDLSENAEYDSAMDEQAENEGRIAQIEGILKNSEVVKGGDSKTVNLGSHVKLLNIKADKEVEYDIVGATAADSMNGKIANDSPLGAAIMGKKANEVVTVETARGSMEWKILKVSKTKK